MRSEEEIWKDLVEASKLPIMRGSCKTHPFTKLCYELYELNEQKGAEDER